MSDQPISAGFLVWQGGAEPKRRFPLSQGVITIGRSRDNGLVIDNDNLSRHHARLTWGGHGWILEDLGSTNGTCVDGQRITGPVVLTPGARVALGSDVVLCLEMDALEAASPTAQGPAAGAGVPGGKGGWRWLLVAGPVVLLGCLAVVVAAYFLLRPDPEGLELESLAAVAGPDVALQEPATGTEVALGEVVMVFALARDEVGVTRLELWIDDQFVAYQDSPTAEGITPVSLVHSWVAWEPGMHGLLVRAYNSGGVVGTSPLMYVTVSGEPRVEPLAAHYVVEPGDSLVSVAAWMSTTVPAIQAENPALGQVITAGQTIVVPVPPVRPVAPGPPPAPPPAPPPGPPKDQPKNQPKNPPKAPVLVDAKGQDCRVNLVWRDNSDNELGFVVYRRVNGAPGFKALPKTEKARAGAGSQVQYVDQVPRPDDYTYYVAAAGSGGLAPSNLEVVTVAPSAACVRPAGYKQVVFRPQSFNPTGSASTSLALYFAFEGSMQQTIYQRIPLGQGSSLPPGDWSKHQRVLPALASLFLNPNDRVLLKVMGEGRGLVPPPRGLGDFRQSHIQKDMMPDKVWSGHGEDSTTKEGFDLTYRLWLENVTWGKGSTTVIPAPTKLRFATTGAELFETRQCKIYGCDLGSTRALVWDWAGDPTLRDGYILYRFYSCPSQNGQLAAPDVVYHPDQGKVIPAWTVPSGCAARYQVSAFGLAGESPPSNALDVPPDTPVARVQVTFKTLNIKKALAPATTAWIVLTANQYSPNANSAAVKSGLHDLAKLTLDGKQPNNVFPVSLGAGDALQLRFWVSDLGMGKTMCGGKTTISPPPANDWGKVAGSYVLQDQDCEVRVEIGNLAVVPVGQTARRRADLSTPVGFGGTIVNAIGKEVYILVENGSPDDLDGNRVQLESYWLDPATNQPRNQQTAVHTLNLPAYDRQFIHGGSIPPDLAKLSPLPEFVAKVTPLDFDDPEPTNNVWQGRPSP